MEAIINSPKIPDSRYKRTAVKQLVELAKQRDKLAQEITERMFLGD